MIKLEANFNDLMMTLSKVGSKSLIERFRRPFI